MTDTTCTATFTGHHRTGLVRCVLPAGHYDGQRTESYDGWHSDTVNVTEGTLRWADWAAGATPHRELPRDGAPLTASQTNEPTDEAHQPLPPERPAHGHTAPQPLTARKLTGWAFSDDRTLVDRAAGAGCLTPHLHGVVCQCLRTAGLRPAWNNGDPLMSAVADAVWEHCRTDGHTCVIDDPRNVAAAAVAAMRAQPRAEHELRRAVRQIARQDPAWAARILSTAARR